MTVTNTSGGGRGIYMSNAKVELVDVALKGCGNAALFILSDTSETTVLATRCGFSYSEYGVEVRGSLTSATFNNCVFNDNSGDGLYVANKGTVHLHGEATAVHSNSLRGIYAFNSGKVLIHLPSHHNTCYNNRSEDRKTSSGGTITNVFTRRLM